MPLSFDKPTPRDPNRRTREKNPEKMLGTAQPIGILCGEDFLPCVTLPGAAPQRGFC